MDLRRRTWLNSLDSRLQRKLPEPAYNSMLAGYHGLLWLTGRNPGRGRMLPDFVIIGAAKAGTTSLYAWLCEHPCVRRPRVKEINYFNDNAYRGADWYRHHFPPTHERDACAQQRGRPFVTGEGSPSYMIHPLAPKRMAKLLPTVKMIVCLRNPIDRAYSQFHMRKRQDQEPVESFLTAAALEDPLVDGGRARALADERTARLRRTYLLRSRYAEHLDRWFAYFPRERFHVLTMEDLAADSQGALDAVHEFLGLPAHRAEDLRPRFTASYDPLPSAARMPLAEYFRPHNDRLYALLGTDFGWER